MIINNNKLIYIHIPKCGGSSLNTNLEKYRIENFNKKIGHSTYLEYKNIVGNKLFNEYKTFMIVRNPWDWHISWFFYLKNKVITKLKHL